MTETMEKRKAEKILLSTLEGIDKRELENITVDDFLDRAFRDDTAAIRPAVTHLLFSYYRNRAALERLVRELAPRAKNKFRKLFAVVMTQIYFSRGIPRESAVNVAVEIVRRRFGSSQAGFANAILRRAAAVDFEKWMQSQPWKELIPAADDLRQRWLRRFDKVTLQQMCRVLRSHPPFTFRMLREIPEAELRKAEAEPVEAREWNRFDRFYQTANPAAVIAAGWLEQGLIYIQDPAASLAPRMTGGMRPDAMALDMCSAPGGKSLILAEHVRPGNLIAADISWRRQTRTMENFRNCGYRENPVIVASAINPPFRHESFDLILLDVPCSNTGVGRHRPDALWAYSKEKATELAGLQSDILDAAAPLLKKNGTLIYSTCSIEPEENDLQIEKFISRRNDFRLESRRELLPDQLHDGAFAAVLRRN